MKYPHTPYFDFSRANHDPDRPKFDLKNFVGKSLVVTIKMDGSNSVLSRDKVAARNGQVAFHRSFDLLKARHAVFKGRIHSNTTLFGEWLYAKHSIHYVGQLALPDYFNLFAAYHEKGEMKEWERWSLVELWAESLGLKTVPVIAMLGTLETKENALREHLTNIYEKVLALGHEGIVVRTLSGFPAADFEKSVAKAVRPNHVQTDEHWSQQQITKNELMVSSTKEASNK